MLETQAVVAHAAHTMRVVGLYSGPTKLSPKIVTEWAMCAAPLDSPTALTRGESNVKRRPAVLITVLTVDAYAGVRGGDTHATAVLDVHDVVKHAM